MAEPGLLSQRMSRGDMLKILGTGAGALFLACADIPNAGSTLIRKEIGPWPQEDVEKLATELINEEGYPNMVFAGKLLLNNQQGNPSFSSLTEIIPDDKIAIKTVGNINASESGFSSEVKVPPMAALLKESDKKIVLTLAPKGKGQPLTRKFPTNLEFKEIVINEPQTRNISGFLTKFFVAKEVLNAKSFDMVSTFLQVNSVDVDYVLPQDRNQRIAVKSGMMDSSYGRMPAQFMADLWSHFLMVPDFKTAVDQKKISQKEISDNLGIFDAATKIFQKEGVLQKDAQGKYRWTQDSDRFFTSWVNLSFIIFNSIGIKR